MSRTGDMQHIRQRVPASSRATVANLAAMARAGSARGLGVGERDAGAAAVVIGGGPSCHGFERIRGTPLVLTVNTAGPRVCCELAPDILCIREMVSTADQVRALAKLHRPGCFVLDIQTHPDVSVAAAEIGVPVIWTVPGQLHLFWLAALLDTRGIYAGESALTQCVAMAERLGCSAVSAIGTNFAFGKDGTAYGDGTAWNGVRVEMRGGVADFGDRGGMREHAQASGVQGPPLRESATQVLMEDGTTGWALATWCSQRLWMEQWATRHPHVRCANLSGGARVEGWPAATETIPGHRAPIPTTALRVDRIEAEVRRQIRCARDIAGSDEPWLTGDMLVGCPLVEVVAAPDYLAVKSKHLPKRLELDELRAALSAAADEVERVFGA